MKVIIPVAGQGIRLKPHTYTLPKVLINVAGKPILGHILDEIKKIGLKDIVFVVGDMADKIKNYVEKNYKFKTTYVFQEKREGLGHAIYLASNYFNKEPVLIILGDTIFKANLKNILKQKCSAIGVKKVNNPKRFGVVKTDNGNAVELIEKSDNPPSNLAIVGIYYLCNPDLLKLSLEKIISNNKKTKGEYQLTDALQEMIKMGEKIKVFEVDGWYDCGKPETLLSTNQILLKSIQKRRVYNLKSSIVVEPVFISKKVKIENSIIGPYVSVAEGCNIKNSIIKNSIISENASIENVLLDYSIIGNSAQVAGRFDRINLGDSSVIDLGYKQDIFSGGEVNANL